MSAAKAPEPRPDNQSVSVIIEAESEDDQKYEWRDRLSMGEPVSVLARVWAHAHGVPCSAVGFDDEMGNEVDLGQTPSVLGWQAGKEVILKAFPTEDRYMEQDSQALVPASKAQCMGSKNSEAAPVDPTADAAAPSPATEQLEVVPKATPPKVSTPAAGPEPARALGASQNSDQAREQLQPRCQDEPHGVRTIPKETLSDKVAPTGPEVAKVPGAPQNSSQAREGAQRSCQDGKRSDTGGTGVASQSNSGDARRGAPAAGTAAGAGRGNPGAPGDDEAIEVEQSNPKREGSSAWARYERYKAAKTVKEALALGAAKGDIAYDLKRGFIKKRRLA